MKKSIAMFSASLLLGTMISTLSVSAEENPKEYSTEGTITFEAGDTEITPPVDPQNPDPDEPKEPVDPPGPGTGGALSIDYGSKLKFGIQKISTTDKVYYAAPDEFKDGTKSPTYVQVTDKRGTLEGWNLSVSQLTQFKTVDGDELEGAQLTFTKGQVASVVDEKYTPTNVTSELKLTPGESSSVAVNAQSGTGVGTWVYRFGENEVDNKDAVQLSVPGKSVKLAQKYQTTLVWSLDNTPEN